MIKSILITAAAATSLSWCLSANAGPSTSTTNYSSTAGRPALVQHLHAKVPFNFNMPFTEMFSRLESEHVSLTLIDLEGRGLKASISNHHLSARLQASFTAGPNSGQLEVDPSETCSDFIARVNHATPPGVVHVLSRAFIVVHAAGLPDEDAVGFTQRMNEALR